jgi:hypothetical protein
MALSAGDFLLRYTQLVLFYQVDVRAQEHVSIEIKGEHTTSGKYRAKRSNKMAAGVGAGALQEDKVRI